MAVVNQILHRKNSSGSYDTVYLQSNLSNVTGTLAVANGGTGATTAAKARTNIGAAASSHSHSEATTSAAGFMSSSDKTKLDGLSNYTHPSAKQCDAAAGNHTHSGYAASSHNHSASNITSGTLSVARGGTGVTTIDALKSALGISSGGAKVYWGTHDIEHYDLVCSPGFTPYIIFMGACGNTIYPYMDRMIGFSIKNQASMLIVEMPFTTLDALPLDVLWSDTSVTVKHNSNYFNPVSSTYVVIGQ